MQFVDFAPVKLVFGPGRLEALRTEPLPGTRALLLTSNGRSMERIGALARVTAILGNVALPWFTWASSSPTRRSRPS